MAVGEEDQGKAADPAGDFASLLPWAIFMVVLIIGGLLLSARAGDNYTAVSGLLFAGFGVFFGLRLLHRVLP
jgi:hypothetical protein